MNGALKFLGQDLDPAELDRALGLAPTQSARRGEPIEYVTPRGQRLSRPATAGYWLFDFTSNTHTELRVEIEALISSSKADPRTWSQLASAYSGQVVLHEVAQISTPIDLLGSHLLHLLEQRGLTVVLNWD